TQHDDGAHLRPQRARTAASLRRRCHPIHVTVRAFSQEVPQPLQRLRDRVWPCDAESIEAVMACRPRERRFERGGIAQKSRSAYVSEGGIPASVSARIGRNDGRDLICAYQVCALSSSSEGTRVAYGAAEIRAARTNPATLWEAPASQPEVRTTHPISAK